MIAYYYTFLLTLLVSLNSNNIRVWPLSYCDCCDSGIVCVEGMQAVYGGLSLVSRILHEHSCFQLSDIDKIQSDDSILLIRVWRIPCELNRCWTDCSTTEMLRWTTGNCRNCVQSHRCILQTNSLFHNLPFSCVLIHIPVLKGPVPAPVWAATTHI